jgi:hypothetical protein
MNEMSNQETDTALILENELKRRVREVAVELVRAEIHKEVKDIFLRQKDSLMFEISVKIGQMLKLIQEEDRKPLWEATPEDFGLTHKDLNKHMIEKIAPAVPTQKEIDDAVRKQTTSV